MACLSPGAPVPHSLPPRPQECAGAGPEAVVAPRVSWAQLSHIRPGPAGRSWVWDAPVPATRPEGWTLIALGRSNGGHGAVEPQGGGEPGAADPRRDLVSLVLSSQAPGLGGSTSVNYCVCFFSVSLFPAPKPCVSGV